MIRLILCLSIYLQQPSLLFAQTKANLEGDWLLEDLDNSIVNFYIGNDDFWYGKILKSDKPIYVHQVIYKGKYILKNSHLEGIFTTPKSKMNISAKIYLDNTQQMRFVGKKYFITKTYIGKRVK